MPFTRTLIVASLALAGASLVSAPSAFAQSVMQQCGQQYQAAKAANTLNGMNWNQFRTACAARLKAQPAAAEPAAQAPATAPAPANPLRPATAPAPAPAPAVAPTTAAGSTSAKPVSAGRAAFVARERQCGAEWKANKPTLMAQTPGLTWPKYLSQCNKRLKAAGQ